MERIEVDVITSEQKIVQLTEQEIAEAKANYEKWLAEKPTKEEQIAQLQAQIDALKGME